MVPTVTRRPRTHALPPMAAGSNAMRGNDFMLCLCVCVPCARRRNPGSMLWLYLRFKRVAILSQGAAPRAGGVYLEESAFPEGGVARLVAV